MIYILSGLTGLLILVALFTFIHKRRHSEDPETIVAPPADCCGAHAICEKGLKKASPQIDYFDDEELDVYRQIAPEAYTDEQIEVFRDILYTLRPEEVEEWLISLEKREINLPLILRQEAIDRISDQHIFKISRPNLHCRQRWHSQYSRVSSIMACVCKAESKRNPNSCQALTI